MPFPHFSGLLKSGKFANFVEKATEALHSFVLNNDDDDDEGYSEGAASSSKRQKPNDAGDDPEEGEISGD